MTLCKFTHRSARARRKNSLFFLCLLGFFTTSMSAAPVSAEKDEQGPRSVIQFHTTQAYRDSAFPLSPAVEAGGFIFLSGALGTVPGQRGLIEGGIEAETRQTMQNISSTLDGLGLNMSNIVKCTAMLADMAEWPAFNRVYKTFFEGDFPARSAFAASGLAANARVEIECIAHRPSESEAPR